MILKNAKEKFALKKKWIFKVFFTFIFITLGMIIQRFGIIGNTIIPYLNEKKEQINIFTNTFKGKVININIPFNDYKKLSTKRKIALDNGFLFNDINSSVSGNLIFGTDTSRIKIRLKGDWISHLDTRKWSFRVELKEDKNLFGLKKFSLHHPRERHWINEWIFHKALSQENIIFLRYYFVKIILNGEDLGIYALEEHFDKTLIENNQKRESVIIKFNENLLWEELFQYTGLIQNFPFSGYGSFNSSSIKGFNQNYINNDSLLGHYYKYSSSMLYEYRNGKLELDDVFDIESLSKYFALCDYLCANHSILWNNLRFYFNPITRKLEPIGFDATIKYNDRLIVDQKNDLKSNRFFLEKLFENEKFLKSYFANLNHYTNTHFWKNFKLKNHNFMQEQIDILRTEWPNYLPDTSIFTKKELLLKNLFSPTHSTISFIENIDGKQITISIANTQKLPLENFSLKVQKKNLYPYSQNFWMKGKIDNNTISFKDLLFKKPNQFIFNNPLGFILKYEILGSNKPIYSSVLNKNPNQFKKINFDYRLINYSNFSFIKEDSTKTKIFFLSGHHVIKENIYFPSDKKIFIYENTKIDFTNYSAIFSKSPFYILGKNENQIIFYSSDSSGQGLNIINSKSKSIINYANFSNFNLRSFETNFKTGAITVYESPIEIKYCKFLENNFEDALNIIRSEFIIDHTYFINNKYDALDIDYSFGEINNSYFFRSGNDAIDFSGSIIEMKNITIKDAGDKGISIGENSKVLIQNVKITDTKIGIASKDLSDLKIDIANVNNALVGFSVFQKKDEFGPASIEAKNIVIESCIDSFWVETKSKLIIDNNQVSPNKENIKEILY